MNYKVKKIKSAFRRSWGGLNPVQRVVKSVKIYNRQEFKKGEI